MIHVKEPSVFVHVPRGHVVGSAHSSISDGKQCGRVRQQKRERAFLCSQEPKTRGKNKNKKKAFVFNRSYKKTPHVVACRSSSGGAVETYLHRVHHHTILCTLQGSSRRYTSPLSLDRSHWHTYPKTGTHRYLQENTCRNAGIRLHNTGILTMS